MSRFPVRYGYMNARSAIQTDNLDEVTRNRLWNRVSELLPTGYQILAWPYPTIWHEHYGLAKEHWPDDSDDAVKELGESFAADRFFEIFDILELLVEIFLGKHGG